MTAPTVPLGHTGHVLLDLAIYLAPVGVVLIWLGVSNLRRRRGDERAAADGPEPGSGAG